MLDIPSSQTKSPSTSPEMNTEDVPVEHGIHSKCFFTAKLLMQRKEVGVIIGRKGEIANQIRNQNNVNLNISDPFTPERVVTITGEFEGVLSALEQICQKFEQETKTRDSNGSISERNLNFRLLIPSSQCGSIIGRSGIRISQLRDKSGAVIQVTGEPLPNSTERAVLISASTSEPIVVCFRDICKTLIEHPSRTESIPYRPSSLTGNAPHANLIGQQQASFNPIAAATAAALSTAYQHPTLSPLFLLNHQQQQYLASAAAAVASLQGFNAQQISNSKFIASANPLYATSAATNQGESLHTREMSIPNELIGCVIGRAGRKITEIRQISGANIKISDLEETRQERRVMITGTFEQVTMAETLIKSRIAAEIQAVVLSR
ncbi:hypothetical protein ACOME3_008103 [Neoechinorhynchus agilis]